MDAHGKAAPHDGAELKVLILHQQGRGRQAGCPEGAAKLRDRINACGVGGRPAVASTFSGWSSASPPTPLIEKLDRACREFDYAVAFVCRDPGAASSVSDLWLQVGFWLGARGGESMLIATEGAGDGRDGATRLPADLEAVAPICGKQVIPADHVCDELEGLVQAGADRAQDLRGPAEEPSRHEHAPQVGPVADQTAPEGAAHTSASLDAKLTWELEAFEAMRSDLLDEYSGLYVAIHHGEVIDSDENDFRLAARIEERARREGAIAVCWVKEDGGDEDDGYPYAHFESPFVPGSI